jgi:hypothetical protein
MEMIMLHTKRIVTKTTPPSEVFVINAITLSLLAVCLLLQLYLIWDFNRSKPAKSTTTKPGVYPIKSQPPAGWAEQGQQEQPKPTDFTSISPGVTHLTEKHDEQALAQED